MSKHNEKKLGEALEGWINSLKWKSNLHAHRIKEIWEKKLGPTIASYTTDVKLIRKKLYISLNSAPLKNELNMGKDKLKDMLNEALGDDFIDEIIFR